MPLTTQSIPRICAFNVVRFWVRVGDTVIGTAYHPKAYNLAIVSGDAARRHSNPRCARGLCGVTLRDSIRVQIHFLVGVELTRTGFGESFLLGKMPPE